MKKLFKFILIVSVVLLIKASFNKDKNNTITVDKDILLVLVNYDNKIPDNFDPKLTSCEGYEVSGYVVNDLVQMLKDAKKDGYNIEISSAYRSYDEQKEIYDKKYNSYIKTGMSKEDAKILTEKEVAIPGYSEHELGLALDLSIIGDYDYKEEAWEYLKLNSYKYGFINRYPEDKVDITKIKYEPWHFRYVGKTYAKEIYSNRVCLEEYLNN